MTTTLSEHLLPKNPAPPKRDFTPPDVYVTGGEVQLDHNPRLSQSDWFGAYGEIGQLDQMRREWPCIQAGCLAWTLTTLAREWSIDPAPGGDASDLMIAKFARDTIRDHYAGGNGGMLGMITPFAELPWRGFVLGQPYYPVDNAIEVRDAEGRLVRKGAHTIQIAPIAQWTLDDWIECEGRDGRREWGVMVYNVGGDGMSGDIGGGRVPFAPSQLVHCRFLPSTDNPAPMGILRPQWALWQVDRTLTKLQVNGWQKAAFGVPEVNTTEEANKEELPGVLQIAANIRSGSASYYGLPPGYSINYREVPFRADGIDKTKQQLKMNALVGMFTHHLGTGSSNGTQALHGSQKAEFHQLAEIVARSIQQTLSEGPVERTPIKRWLSLNFQGIERYPILNYGQRPVADPVAFAAGLVQAADGGLLTPDSNIEARIREAFGLGDMPAETEESWMHRLQNSKPPEISSPEADEDGDDGGDDGGGNDGGPDQSGAVGGEGVEETEDASDVAPIEAADHDAGSTPAPPADRIRGSKRNPEGSASGRRGGIEVSATVEKALRNKVDQHNERRTAKSRKVDMGMLKAVYRRGAGAYSVSHRPGMTRNQWSMGRVNGFLKRVAGTGGHPQDDDLLPEGHPNKPKEMSEHMSRRVAGCIATKLTEGMEYDQALATCLSMEEAGRLGPRGGYMAKTDDKVVDDRYMYGPRGRKLRLSESVVRYSETEGAKDAAKDELTKTIVDWRERVAKDYGEAIAKGASNLGDVARIPIPRQKELERELIPVLRRIYRAGGVAVENELDRAEANPEIRRAIIEGEVKVADYQQLSEDAYHGPSCSCCNPGLPGLGLERKMNEAAPEWGMTLRKRLGLAEGDTYTPPEAVRDAARRALEVRAEKPPSQRGMTPVGLARARDLMNGRPIAIRTMRRMASYFARHEVDKQGKSWDEKGPGWQAWNGWGGDAGRSWVTETLRREDAQSMAEHSACPAATKSVEINTRNRDATVRRFDYGPLNVDEPGDYWEKIAKAWDTTEEAARKSLCGNCVAFDISPRMEECMPGPVSDDDGRLGYCWMHHFKCHSARTCKTWAKGGPITKDEVSLEWALRNEGAIKAADLTPKSAGGRRARQPEPKGEEVPEIDDIDPEEAIRSVASTTVSAQADRMRATAARILQSSGIGGALPENPAQIVRQSVLDLSSGTDRAQAQSDANTIFGLGRLQKLRSEGAETFTFSNMLESDTCQYCAQYDGATFGRDELFFYATPFALCEGGDRCNCLVIGIP